METPEMMLPCSGTCPCGQPCVFLEGHAHKRGTAHACVREATDAMDWFPRHDDDGGGTDAEVTA